MRDYRFKPIGFRAFAAVQVAVAANAEQLVNFPGISADHVVVNIPGGDTQRFFCVKSGPRLWCFKCREVEQTFIHNRKCIGHFPGEPDLPSQFQDASACSDHRPSPEQCRTCESVSHFAWKHVVESSSRE